MNRRRIKCTVCNHDATYYNELKEVIIYKCKNCQHLFTDHEYIKNKEDYSSEYFTEKHPNWFENPDLKLFNFIFNYIKKKNLSSPSILDVGCGNGDFLRYLRKNSKNIKLTGIDYKKNSNQEDINFITGDIFDTKFKEQFDVVIALAVIEHIWDVKAYVMRLRELCKKDGLILVMTPNNSSLLYGFARNIYYLGMKLPMERLYDKHHLNHFTKNSLEYLFKSCSLEIIENKITQFNINSLSIPKSSFLMKIIYKFGLSLLFIIEKFFWRQHMQTIVVRKINK